MIIRLKQIPRRRQKNKRNEKDYANPHIPKNILL